jgi:predicted AlkP superfamily phosphohydrolase/phosphomutase/Tfp pilus assembly protein PilF
MRSRVPTRLWLTGLAVALAFALASGFFRVRPGEVVLVGTATGALSRLVEEGWSWKPPLLGVLLRLPRPPIDLGREISWPREDGSTATAVVDGRFGLAAGGGERWIAEVGWQPFVDGLDETLRSALAEALASVPRSDLFLAGTHADLPAAVARHLASSGIAAEDLTVVLPAEKNRSAYEAVRRAITDGVEPSGRKVLVIGWDGADWLMIRPLLEAGRLPNLARLVNNGVSGDFRSEKPLLSPLIWTTVGTGKSVIEHGIADFLVQDTESGAYVPVSSESRKVHALWTILDMFGLSTDVVGWWATWPAERFRGTMVSDRVAYQLFAVPDAAGADKVHPPEMWPPIAELLVPAESIGYEQISRFVEIERSDFDRRWESLPPDRRQEDPVNHLRKILATTRSYHDIARSLLAEQADLTLLYYEGTDTVGHLFARYLPPRMEGVTDEEVRRFGKTLPAFYAYADELLGELLDAAGPDTVTLLISDHGFFTGEARPASDPSDFAGGAPQWHRLYGVIAAAGPGVSRGEIKGSSIYDIAPTILSLLGLPVPRDMPGRVLEEIGGTHPKEERTLSTYEVLPLVRTEAGQRSAELDQERLRELAALGYISASTAESQGRETTAEGETPAERPQTDLQGMATEAYNRGRIFQNQGEYAKAQEQYRIAAERLPSFGPAYANLAQLESLQGNHCRAVEILAEGFSKSTSLPMAAVTGIVDEARSCGNLEDAARLLSQLDMTYKRMSAYPGALGLLSDARGNLETALTHYRGALEMDPLDQLANEQIVSTLRRLGRETEARDQLAQAFDLAAGNVTAMNQLSVVALRQGWADAAERFLRRVLESDPGNPGVLANLAASLMRQGRRDEALEAMSEAVERDPENAGNHFNLGAMLASQGRHREALVEFETAMRKGLRSPRVHVAAAKMHFRLGDRQASQRELQSALALDPGDTEATRLLAALERGG